MTTPQPAAEKIPMSNRRLPVNKKRNTQPQAVFWTCFALTIFISTAVVAAEPAGIVLLHGKQGSPTARSLQVLASRLAGIGWLVSTPEMPWSGARIYDRSYEQAMGEIGEAVKKLKDRGAVKIFVGGQSLGANAALRYAAQSQVAGVLALAPGHIPDLQSFPKDLARARRMIDAGNGDERASFEDSNQGKKFTVQTTARIYLSYMDPDGAAVMPKSAAAIKPGTPLLWVVGTADGMSNRGPSYAFDKAPPNPQSKYLVVNSDHADTPRDAADEIIAWLKAVQN
jgi:pimeloyl-ACP methyl ester carboxylesterase